MPIEESRALNKLLLMLRSHVGHDFLLYKNTTIQRRVERRMVLNETPTVRDYLRLVQHKPEELDTLFRELLIGVTQFFRDPSAFHALELKAIRPLVQSKQPGEALRVWVSGCSTGEEVYSIAMLIHEQMTALEIPLDVQIFATDIRPEGIATAADDLRQPAAVLLFDANLQYTAGDRDALQRIGLSEAELEGPTRIPLFPDDDGSELEAHYRAALRGDNVYFERGTDGARFGVQVMPLRDGAGKIVAGIVVISVLGKPPE